MGAQHPCEAWRYGLLKQPVTTLCGRSLMLVPSRFFGEYRAVASVYRMSRNRRSALMFTRRLLVKSGLALATAPVLIGTAAAQAPRPTFVFAGHEL